MKNEFVEMLKEDNYCELLAGYKDEDGDIHKEVEYTDITGEVEEEISKADVKRNAGRIINTLLTSCVTRIGDYKKEDMTNSDWEEIIKDLYVGDQDWVVLNIRKTTQPDEDIEIVRQCTNRMCQQENRIFVEPEELEILEFKGSFETGFELPKGYKKEKRGEEKPEIRKKFNC